MILSQFLLRILNIVNFTFNVLFQWISFIWFQWFHWLIWFLWHTNNFFFFLLLILTFLLTYNTCWIVLFFHNYTLVSLLHHIVLHSNLLLLLCFHVRLTRTSSLRCKPALIVWRYLRLCKWLCLNLNYTHFRLSNCIIIDHWRLAIALVVGHIHTRLWHRLTLINLSSDYFGSSSFGK